MSETPDNMQLALRETFSYEVVDFAQKLKTKLRDNPDVSDDEINKMARKCAKKLAKQAEIRVQQEREDAEAEAEEKEEALEDEKAAMKAAADLASFYNYSLHVLPSDYPLENLKAWSAENPEELGTVDKAVDTRVDVDTTFVKLKHFVSTYGSQLGLEASRIFKVDPVDLLPPDFRFTGWGNGASAQYKQYRKTVSWVVPYSARETAIFVQTHFWNLSWTKVVMEHVCKSGSWTMPQILDLLNLDPSKKHLVESLRFIAHVTQFKSIPRRTLFKLILSDVFEVEILKDILEITHKDEIAEVQEHLKEAERMSQEQDRSASEDNDAKEEAGEDAPIKTET